MYKKFVLSLLVPILLLAGCASNNYTDAPPSLGVLYSKYAYLGYTGSVRPIDEVGIVTTDGLIKIVAVDGQSVVQLKRFREKGFYSGGRFQLHLLPGRHTLTLGFHDDRGSGSVSWSTSNVVKTIEIKAGQVTHLALSTSGRTWTANVLDGSSARDAIVEDFNALSRERSLE